MQLSSSYSDIRALLERLKGRHMRSQSHRYASILICLFIASIPPYAILSSRVGHLEIWDVLMAAFGPLLAVVLITTSSFTTDALEYVNKIDSKVVLIDGQQLATYMIDFDLGVSVVGNYAVKRVDSDYFEEE